MKRAYLKYMAFGMAAVLITLSCSKEESSNGSDNGLKAIDQLDPGQIIPDNYIVVLKNDGSAFEADPQAMRYEEAQAYVTKFVNDLFREKGISNDQIHLVYGKAIVGFSAYLTPSEYDRLRSDEAVEYIEEDKVIALAPGNGKGKPGGGGSGTPPPQSTPWGIIRVGGAGNGVGKVAWILDSGIDLDHPDLNVSTTLSQSFLSGKESTNPDDQHGHGTHVAGTVAAVNNTEGVVGVAAGATVVSVRVLDRRGSGTISSVVGGINYVAGMASSGDVANMSLGGGASTTIDNAVSAASASCKFVLAAGNNGIHANNSSPARVNGPNIYTISACDKNDVMASFSNYGNPPVDYAAPGVSVTSCYKDGGYATMSGTSMSAPHVAGILLLGPITPNGFISGDKDNNPDPIAHR